MAVYSWKALVELLKEKQKDSEEELKEAQAIDPNCYAAGYEAGILDTIKELLDEIPEENH